MSGFTPFSQSAPNMGNVAKGSGTNPLLLLLSALAAIKPNQQATKAADTDIASKQAQTQNEQARTKIEQGDLDLRSQQFQQQQQDVQRQRDQQQWTTLGQRVMTNPAWAASPQIKSQLESLAQKLGLPTPYKEDGTIDEHAFMQPLSSIPMDASGEKVREFILAQPPGEPRINAARSANIVLTDAEAHAASNFTAKAATDMQRATQQGVHFANMDKTQAARAKNLGILQDAQAHKFDADATYYTDRAAVVQQEANAHTMTAQAAMKRADAEMVKAKAALQRAAQGIRGNQGLATKFYSSANEALARAQREAAGADAAYEAASANAADESVLQPLENAKHKYDAEYTAAKAQVEILKTELGSNTPLAAGVKNASGARSATVTDAGPKSKYVPGQIYTDAHGNRATFNGGDPKSASSWTSQ